VLRARITVLATGLLALVAVIAAARSPQAEAQPSTIRAAGSAIVDNTKQGTAILAGRLGPGDSLTGAVTIGNIGSGAGDFTLSLSHLVDTPAATAAALSGRLQLAVDDVTRPSTPVKVYRGTIGALPPTALGTFASGATRTYRLTVTWLDGGAADAAYAGSAMSAEFDWSTASSDEEGTAPPPPPTGVRPRLDPPRLLLRATKKQRVVKRRGAIVHASCDEACTLTVRAKISLRRSHRAMRLRTATRHLAAGRDTKLKLKLPKALLRRLRAALRAHRQPVLKITGTATSADGLGGQPITRNVRVVR
jgi:hypothetical protein